MKNHASSRAGKGKTAYRTPSTFKSNRPELLKSQNAHVHIKATNKKFRAHPSPFSH
jgi:hypothetical protein